jgi:hypothetical protein
MKNYFILAIFLFFLNTLYAQEWVLIEKADDVNNYMRLDRVPVSPRNEVEIYSEFTKAGAKKWQKTQKYNSLPFCERKKYAFNDAFDSIATRSYHCLDIEGNSLLKEFHGFLTYNRISEWGWRAANISNWAELFKKYGSNACLYASQILYNNGNAEWVKFHEDEKMERFIRVDMSNVDSLALYKVVYKKEFLKELSKEYKEVPNSRIFLRKVYMTDKNYIELADTWLGKNFFLTTINIYPLSEKVSVESLLDNAYFDWTKLLFDQGKNAVIEKSNSLFGKNIGK